MAKYSVYRLEGFGSGITPNVVIVKQGDDTVAVFWRGPDWDHRKAASVLDDPIVQQAVQDGKPVLADIEDFKDARFWALKEQVGRPFRAQVATNSMPLAWIAFTQILYVAILYSPGVRFIGSAYATVAQVAVALSAVMSNAPYLMTASRVSTAVAIGNFALALLVWQSAYSMSDKIAAAYRAAIVSAVGFCIVCTNQYLTRVSTPM